MSEPKLITPLLADHLMGDPISNHHGVRCCPAMRKDTEDKYIVKILSIPASQVQLEALLLTGAYSSKEAALEYFKELSDGVVQEAEILRKLSFIEGFCSYEDWQIVPMDDGVGFDVYLLGAYRPTLERFFKTKPMTHLAAVNLGLDLCAALSVCRRNGYLYIDLKPGNVFLTENQEYRIGDLGFVRLSSLKYASLPERYRSAYTAPEITDAYSALNATLDVFSAGMILYQAYNNGQLPDMTQFPAQPLTPPAYADYEMAQIILKACATDPSERWQDPAQMGQALVSYMQCNSVNDVPIVPPAEPEVAPQEPEETPIEIAEAEEPESVEMPLLVAEDIPAETEVIPAEEVADEAEPEEETEDTAEEAPAAEVDAPAEIEVEESTVAIPAEEESAVEAPAEEQLDMLPHENLTAKDSDENVQFVIAGFQDEDTEATEEILAELESTDVTDEVSAMLAQADELIAHKTPDPVVAPEPIEIPIPAPIVLKDDEKISEEATEPEVPSEEPTDDAPQLDTTVTAVEDMQEEVGAEEEYEEEEQTYLKPYQEKPRKKRGGLVGAMIAILIVLLLAIGAFFYYENYYLQLVSGITVSGEAGDLTVRLDTEISNELLTVYCTDINGNKLVSTVTGNQASFTGLHPGTNYKVTVEISGFHQLIGSTSANYTTDPQTTIVSFTAIAGDQDGAVTLNFTVQGQENTAWRIRYSTPGEKERVADCTGHIANITGLTVGKVYTFRLEPVADLYVVGNHTLEFTAPKMIYPENLATEGYNGGALIVTWNAPDGANVNSWTVRCYNNSGFDKTITVTEPKAAIEGLDPTQSYTVDVKAEGMTIGQWISVSANIITFKDILLDDSNPGELVITWNHEGITPADGWVLLYTINGGEKHVVHTTANYCSISPILPGAVYDISFELPEDVTVFGGTAQYTAQDNGRFDSYGVDWEDFSCRMCWTPADPGWRWYNLLETNFTNTFAAGEKASLILLLDGRYEKSDDEIETLFVIRDEQGNIVSMTPGRTRVWSSMWSSYNGRNGTELDMPTMPQTAGEYSVDIYFNGALLTTQAFIVK